MRLMVYRLRILKWWILAPLVTLLVTQSWAQGPHQVILKRPITIHSFVDEGQQEPLVSVSIALEANPELGEIQVTSFGDDDLSLLIKIDDSLKFEALLKLFREGSVKQIESHPNGNLQLTVLSSQVGSNLNVCPDLNEWIEAQGFGGCKFNPPDKKGAAYNLSIARGAGLPSLLYQVPMHTSSLRTRSLTWLTKMLKEGTCGDALVCHTDRESGQTNWLQLRLVELIESL